MSATQHFMNPEDTVREGQSKSLAMQKVSKWESPKAFTMDEIDEMYEEEWKEKQAKMDEVKNIVKRLTSELVQNYHDSPAPQRKLASVK